MRRFFEIFIFIFIIFKLHKFNGVLKIDFFFFDVWCFNFSYAI